MFPLISVIIVNYRSERCLGECVASVYAKFAEKITFEIIIVNNDPDAELTEIRKSFPDAKIISAGKNLGFGAGCNLGAASSSGDIFLFLNPDAQIYSENIQEITSLFGKDPSLGIIGSRITRANGRVQKWSAGYEIDLINIVRNNLQMPKSAKIWNAERPTPAHWVSGTALFIRNDLFKKLGGFDENFFMYFEDMDLCKRAGELEQKVVYCPNFTVTHSGGKSYSEKNVQKNDYYRSQEYYFKKHRCFLEWLVVKLLGKIFT